MYKTPEFIVDYIKQPKLHSMEAGVKRYSIFKNGFLCVESVTHDLNNPPFGRGNNETVLQHR